MNDISLYVNGIMKVVESLQNENKSLKEEISILKKLLEEQSSKNSETQTLNAEIIHSAIDKVLKKTPPAEPFKVFHARAKAVEAKSDIPENPNYREVIRVKSKREVMEGYKCDMCESFYKSVNMECKCVSKHKMHRPITETPEGFWDPWNFNSLKCLVKRICNQ
jgi:hypothetical protein